MGPVSLGNTTISGVEMEARVLRVAAGFEAEGLRRGDGVAIAMRNEPAFLEASLGAGMLGLYPVPINWHCHPAELRFIVEDSGARAIVMHADLWPHLAEGVPEGVLVLLAETPRDVIDAYGIDPASAVPPAGFRRWAEWRDSFAPRTAPALQAPQMILYTSGTTGRPKGVKRPEMTAEQVAVFGEMLMRTYGFTGAHGQPGEIVSVATGPFYHGLPNGHAHYVVRAGATLIVMPRFDAEELLAIIARERVTHLALVPIMFNRLLRLPEAVRRKYDVSSLRFVSHAAAPVSPQVKQEMIAWWGPVITEYYGSTETANVAFCNSAEWLAHPGTVGRAPEGTELRVVDDEGREMPPGTPGHIVCRIHGSGTMTYVNNEQARRNIELVPGLITAGDIGYLDEDGFLFLCDRSKDMIISGGVNIYPAEIEGVLHKMPGVADCAVFGIPDDEYGEAVHAVVQPQPGAEIDAPAVRAYLRARIAGHQVPRTVHFADDLPREDSGKIFKRRLREPFWADTGRSI